MNEEHFKGFEAILWVFSSTSLLQKNKQKKKHVVWVDLMDCLKDDEGGPMWKRGCHLWAFVLFPHCASPENSCHSVWLKQICLLFPVLFPRHHKHRPHPPRTSSIFSLHPLPPSPWLLFPLKRTVAIQLLTPCQLLWWQHVSLSKSKRLASLALSFASWRLGFNVLFIFT